MITKYFDKHAFKNLNTFYPLPTVRISYESLEPTYLDIMWLNYGIEIRLPFSIDPRRA